MRAYSLKNLFCYVGHSIFYPTVKGLFVILALKLIFEPQVALAIGFKTYINGVRAKILRYQEIIRTDPLDAIAYFQLGRAYLALGQHKKEVEAYLEAIQLNQKYIAPNYNLSIAYDLLNDGPNAIKYMLRTLNLSSEKRNHMQIRNVQRQLKRLYLKYPDKPSKLKRPNYKID